MAGSYGIRITPRALKDLESIFEYIQRDSPQNAAKVIRRIMDAIDGLDMMPYRYSVPRTGAIRNRRIRSMPVWPYLVRYHIDEPRKTVHILRIRHGAMRRP